MVNWLFFAVIWVAFCFGFQLENGRVSKLKTTSENCLELLVNPEVFSSDSLRFYAEKFDRLNTKIRDGKIAEANAKRQMAALLPALKRTYFSTKIPTVKSGASFPVQGYTAKAIGGTNGSGYLPKGYNYYHGNRHTGHPAHDIFIYDQDQNDLDDRSNKPVKIAAISDGVVVATAPQWEANSLLRGGIYVWLYNPTDELLYYYAHNQSLKVKPGDLVKAGQELGMVGRTGLNAAKKRSPTHLHFMALSVTPDASLPPVDLYKILVKL